MERILALRIEENDNVATAFSENVMKGMSVAIVDSSGKEVDAVITENDIPYGHKLALEPIEKGSDVIKYGISIGAASAAIKKGEHVHIHNLESKRGRGDLIKEKMEAEL